MRVQASAVGVIAPELGRQLEVTMAQMPQSAPWSSTPQTFIHGDFAPSQLLVDGPRVAIVDLDKSCIGDPAIDVGNFTAKLHRRAVAKGRNHYRQLASHFLQRYQECAPNNVSDERARLFQALTLVRIAIHTFQRSPASYARQGSSSLPLKLLKEATECLVDS
jgi:aminoglycoside phosphotransferase (APT) family kinase protein